jgi:hypothetical protein
MHTSRAILPSRNRQSVIALLSSDDPKWLWTNRQQLHIFRLFGAAVYARIQDHAGTCKGKLT